MVNAGKKFIQKVENTLSFDGADFYVTERIGAPWTVILANAEYKTITLDFGKRKVKWYIYLEFIFSACL